MLGFGRGPTVAGPVKKGAVLVWIRVTFWASGSAADPVTVTNEFSAPFTVAGAVITGTRFTFAITTDVAAVEVPAVGVFVSVAVQLTVYVPAWLKFGVPVNVRLGFAKGPALDDAVKNGALFV